MAGLTLHLTLVEEVCDERLRLDENALQTLANFALNIIHEQKPLGNGGDVELAIACVDQATSQRLNATYRHKDKPTNVLSFGTDFAQLDGAIMLGDLVICLPVVLAEATKHNKPPAAHFTHLLIHGLLHLLGYDHETCTDAAIMEGLEIDILAQLGLANPYAGDYEAD